MDHVGLICPNAPGHLNPMIALADAMRSRGHRVTFFLLGSAPGSVTSEGFEVVEMGGSVFPAGEYRAGFERLGTLTGRAALRHTFALGLRSTEAILQVGPGIVRGAGVTALIVDQASMPGGTVADELGLPFVTVCNALLLNPDPIVPPFFTPWRPGGSAWGRLKNKVAWGALNRMYGPILGRLGDHRKRLGLATPGRVEETWSGLLQVSQQPEAFEFPRSTLPAQFRFVGPLRLPEGRPYVPFPWERLDGRPLVYASLGTLQNRLVDSFRIIADACTGLDAQLVISTGHGLDPAAFDDHPARPVVVSYAPQRDLIRRASLAITHAGLNTALDCLSAGVPMVAMPVTNEQPGIAARVAWVGAGKVLPIDRATPALMRSLIDEVRGNPSYRVAAGRVRESVEAGGGTPRAAELIEAAFRPVIA